MAHYVAIIEDAGPDHAIGVWFPDLRTRELIWGAGVMVKF